jgi:hypothetical protein
VSQEAQEAPRRSIPLASLKPVAGLQGPKDLTIEEYREYEDLKNKVTYRIDNPVAFYYRDGGTTHRVVDAKGVVHCVPYGVGQPVVLRWKNRGEDPVGF